MSLLSPRCTFLPRLRCSLPFADADTDAEPDTHVYPLEDGISDRLALAGSDEVSDAHADAHAFIHQDEEPNQVRHSGCSALGDAHTHADSEPVALAHPHADEVGDGL